ncbi:hypothetical protein STRTUCAR8_01591 [Streptomyces turgidiscabies Car8]|uniref:Uncharacterized protein n=1 Tax=Streptomyces turgidiscabies (strain Car8) TaxID=698760 RepID=L7F4T7_STRT8|nr:hypothetical protein STRTUCAR8_01591 [Streptomyces turgidiscabies Car8]
MSRLTPEQAADRLGIADEHVDVFPRQGATKAGGVRSPR